MPDIILGYQNARLTHITTAGRQTTIEMALTNLNGRQIETIEPVGIEKELVNLEIEQALVERDTYQIIYGYRLHWTLTYADFASGEDLVSLGHMLYGLTQGDTLRFTPRIDFPNRYFNVVLTMNTLNVGVSTGGSTAGFNKDFIISFKTKNIVRDLNWTLVPDPATVFGVMGKQHVWVTAQ